MMATAFVFPGAPPKPPKRGPKSPKPIARKARPARVRRTEHGQKIDRLKSLFARVVKLRDGYLCRIHREGCQGDATDAAHLYCVSTFPRLRFDLRVAIAACRSCHTYMDTHPAFRSFVLAAVLAPATQQALAFANAVSPDLDEVARILRAELRRLNRR